MFSLSPEPEDDRLSSYDYHLPLDRIAQNPIVPRDRSRLLTLTSPRSHSHDFFYQLPDRLQPGDLLVMNDTRVIPARLYGIKMGSPSGGAAIEVLLLEEQAPEQWLALVKPGKRLKPGAEIYFIDPHDIDPHNNPHHTENDRGESQPPAELGLRAQVLAIDEATGGRILQFHCPEKTSFWDCLRRLGQVPLPPYITQSQADAEQYQTVYNRQPGAVAAPTAGLHFTPALLDRLVANGILYTTVTLHVGVGTFRPVETENVAEHTLHGEWVDLTADTVAKIKTTQAQGGRIIAVGTTVVRSLEGVIAQTGSLQPFRGKVNLFIRPGFQWQVVSGLITNFHLPKSSLLLLVSALVGRKRLLDLYAEAIEQQYRFYSFGDAMLILPEARPGAGGTLA